MDTSTRCGKKGTFCSLPLFFCSFSPVFIIKCLFLLFRIKTWFNQPARKLRRHNARVAKAAKAFPKPIGLLRPVVHCCTSRYNANTREGRGFTKEELKGAKLNPVLARSIGIAIDYRRKNRSEEYRFYF